MNDATEMLEDDKRLHSRFFRNIIEFRPLPEIHKLPNYVNGLYVLYKCDKTMKKRTFIYLGMARGKKSGIKGRLRSHRRTKNGKWTHFSVYEFVDGHRETIVELEALMLRMFVPTKNPKILNGITGSAVFKSIKRKSFDDWLPPPPKTENAESLTGPIGF